MLMFDKMSRLMVSCLLSLRASEVQKTLLTSGIRAPAIFDILLDMSMTKVFY